MSDKELIALADETLGIVFDPDTKRTKMLTAILNAAFAISDS